MSVVNIETINPYAIPFQGEVVDYVENDFDYSKGVNEILLSGTIGSAKTTLVCHLICLHVINNPGAEFLILRKALKDLKRTIWKELLRHWPKLNDWLNKSDMTIRVPNGSIIYGDSYHDGDYEKFRSYTLSGFAVEEAVEADSFTLYDELFSRCGRAHGVNKNLAILLTNPDSPSHWIYEKFIEKPTGIKKVFYSHADDNPFLPEWYLDNVRKNMDPKRARRLLYGEWIEITTDVIYHQYNQKLHYKKESYSPDPGYPVHVTWDFNIGVGKPLSGCLFQYINDHFHFFKEFVIEGANTAQSCEHLESEGLLRHDFVYIINGDATGKSRTTKSNLSDYDIIVDYFKRLKLNFEKDVPLSNPSIRDRHNTVNAYLKNDLGEVRISVYKDCPTLHKGLKLTSLKKGSNYIEDDSKEWQHITTALGYGICSTYEQINTPQFAIHRP